MAVSLPDFPPFDVEREPTSLNQRWKKWVGRFENLIIALDIKQSKRKKALLLHYAGPAVQETADTLPPAARDDDRPDEYDATLAQLNGYFNPKKNVEYEIFTFRQAREREEETLDQFQTRLRQLSQNCEFESLDREIKSQIVQGCLSTRLRRRALRDSKMTLSDLLTSGRSLETSELQATGMEKTSCNFSIRGQPVNLQTPQNNEYPKQAKHHMWALWWHISTPRRSRILPSLRQLLWPLWKSKPLFPTLPLQEQEQS